MSALPRRWSPLLILAAACASPRGPATTTSAPAAPSTMRVSTPGGNFNIRVQVDEMRSSFIVPAPPDQVWRALPAVFDSLGIAVDVSDPTARHYGASNLRVRGRLGPAPVSRYFDCGSAQIGENADHYDVRLQVLVSLAPAPAGTTTVEVLLAARARPVAFSQGYQSCSTRGTLDVRLVELLRARAARG